MEKAVYGLAADLHAVHYDIGEGFTEFYTVGEVEFASNIALTLEHKPKKLITTTADKENGELIIVKRGPLVFFKFTPTTQEGERLYRHVKQRKLRQCSYIFHQMHNLEEEETKEKLSWAINENDKIAKYDAMVFELCLTNTPRDANTFCTTDVNHPLLRGIKWETNIEYVEGTDDYLDSWYEREELSDKIDIVQQQMEDIKKKFKKIQRKRSFK